MSCSSRPSSLSPASERASSNGAVACVIAAVKSSPTSGRDSVSSFMDVRLLISETSRFGFEGKDVILINISFFISKFLQAEFVNSPNKKCSKQKDMSEESENNTTFADKLKESIVCYVKDEITKNKDTIKDDIVKPVIECIMEYVQTYLDMIFFGVIVLTMLAIINISLLVILMVRGSLSFRSFNYLPVREMI